MLIGAGALALVGAGFAATGARNLFWSVLSEDVAEQLDVTMAYELAEAGEIILLDIRRPDEWEATGSPASGHRLDMRREDFTEQILVLTAGALNARVALICARGVRSSRLANQLTAAGFTNIIDVPEGMLGSIAGPGWVRAGLPVTRN